MSTTWRSPARRRTTVRIERMPRARVVVFDAYGTIFDVQGALRDFRDRIGPDWERVSREWRVKQMEYTWVRSLVGPSAHRDFWRLTREALELVAARHGIADAALLDAVADAYRRLPAFPDVMP